MGEDSRTPERDASAFGATLRLYRRSRGLSQEELADATRGYVAVRTISDLERGVARRPRWDTAGLLAVALGLAGPELDAFLRAAARPPVVRRAPRPLPTSRLPAVPAGLTVPACLTTPAALTAPAASANLTASAGLTAG
jgi:transcriptional regulator with XRE-family HTH domain